jgi:hypothetical protein
MKKLLKIIIPTMICYSCEIDHSARWEVLSAPNGGDRNRKVIGFLKKESDRIGLKKSKALSPDVIFAYKNVEALHESPAIEVRSVNSKLVISLSTGWDSRVSDKESFYNVERNINEMLKREIKTDFSWLKWSGPESGYGAPELGDLRSNIRN